MMLSLRETHPVFLRITKLIREDDHEVLAREVPLQLIRQTFQRSLIRDGTLTGCHHHEQMILKDL